MDSIKRALEFTQKVAQRYNLKPPFSKVFVREAGLGSVGVYQLRIDMAALNSFLGVMGRALENESEEASDLVTAFLGLVNQIQEDPGQDFNEDWIN
jgi:hypothetical protein